MPETAAQARARRSAIRYASKPDLTSDLLTLDVAPVGGAVMRTAEQIRAQDLDIDKLVLDGVKRKVGTRKKGRKRVAVYDDTNVRIEDSLIDAIVERTIEGASTLTLTVHDPEWVLIGSGIFDSDDNGALDPIDVKLDKLWFRLVSVEPQGNTLTLIFEDREVAYLRGYDKPRSVARKKKTRAQFVEMLVREVKQVRIKLFAPEKSKRQPIAKSAPADTSTGTSTPHGASRGLHRGQEIKIKGQTADAAQRRNVEIALKEGDSTNAPKRAVYAALIGGIQESQFRNLRQGQGDGTSAGVLQETSDHGSEAKRRNVKAAFHTFYTKGFTGAGGAISIARKNPNMSVAEIAATVQGNRAGASDYAPHVDEAREMIKAWGESGGAEGGSTSRTRVKQYRFMRGDNGQREDSWTAMQRLAQDVSWRCFMRSGVVWFVSEDWLLNKQRVLAVISRTSKGIRTESFGYKWDTGQLVKELTFDVSADRWAFPPGSVIQIKDSGTANGKWLVHSISKSLFKSTATITLSKAIKAKPEPAAETETVDSGSSGGGGSDDTSKVSKVYNKALAIAKKDYPYVWGGGHARAGSPSGGGYDCSGYTAANLDAGGMLPKAWKSGVPASGTFASSWGDAGKGEEMTVWANGAHIFIEFHGRHGKYADTSRQAGGKAGAQMRYGRRSTAGFTPRHWPGT